MLAREMAQQPPSAVLNQPPPLENFNLFEWDTPLREALRREDGGGSEERALAFGALLGRAETLALGDLANHYPPTLRAFDRFGRRIDEVEYHPAYHEQMRLGVEWQLHSSPWRENRGQGPGTRGQAREQGSGGAGEQGANGSQGAGDGGQERAAGRHVARAALVMLRHQLDEGPSCPLTMTFAVIPALRKQPEIAAEWEPRVLSAEYDPRSRPAWEKRGCLFGMGMTERQGGSDVQANTTRAEPIGVGGPGGEYRLTGHKWFCSAPMCDAFLVLAQAPRGLSCFLLPRWTPDGARNAFHILRLKEKVGNRSNASSEVEFRGAWARMVGEEGRGVATIIEMVRHTRLDCALGSAGTLRRAVAEATHHAAYRYAFGRRLLDQPLMQNVLADLCLESEAATALAMRIARGFDEAVSDEAARLYTRVVTSIGKYWITKRAMAGVAEALECVGGNGIVEESPLARLYRDVPVNSIWEGSGNIQCLDVLRAVAKEPAALDVILAELRAAAGVNSDYDNFLWGLERELAQPAEAERRARRLVERLALALQAGLLIQHAPPAVSDAFCASRLAEPHLQFGTLPPDLDMLSIIERARPRLD